MSFSIGLRVVLHQPIRCARSRLIRRMLLISGTAFPTLAPSNIAGVPATRSVERPSRHDGRRASCCRTNGSPGMSTTMWSICPRLISSQTGAKRWFKTGSAAGLLISPADQSNKPCAGKNEQEAESLPAARTRSACATPLPRWKRQSSVPGSTTSDMNYPARKVPALKRAVDSLPPRSQRYRWLTARATCIRRSLRRRP